MITQYYTHKQPSRGIFIKRCSENMLQIYRRRSMPKCDFNKVALQLYWNRNSAWVFSCKFAAYFQNTFSEEHLWTAASVHSDNTNFYPIISAASDFSFHFLKRDLWFSAVLLFTQFTCILCTNLFIIQCNPRLRHKPFLMFISLFDEKCASA